MLRRTVLHVSLCMLLAQHITGEPQNIAGLQNEDIVLCPVLDGKLEEITWKLGSNKIAEYDLFKVKAYYGDFKEQSELNITSGCLKMNNITDRRDGLYKAELQIGGKLQYHEFKLKVYRPVSKPTVTCSVTDSNVTLICEGDESLGDHYRWEGHENQVLRVTNEGKYLTFSKEENHNIEYTCIFSNLKSEERSDPVKNCFVPGGRSHILVLALILVLLAVAGLAGLYKCYSQSQGRKTADYQAVHNEEGNSEATTKTNMQSTLPLHGPQQCDVHVDATVNSKATENAHTGKKELVNGTEEIRAPDPGINEQSKMGSAEKGTQDEEQQKKETEDAQTSSESRENANTGKKEVVNGTEEIPAPDPGSNEQSNKGSAEKGTQDEEQQKKESEDAQTSPESREKANTGKKEVVNGTEEIPAPDPGSNEQNKMESAEKGPQDEEQQRKESEDAETSSESRATENANTGKKEVVNGTQENLEPVPGINEQSNKGSAEKGTQDEEQQKKEPEDAETSPESRDVTPLDVQGMATTPLPARDMENAAAPPPLEIVKTPPTSETAVAPPSPETAVAPPSPETAVAPPSPETAVAPPSPETAVAPPSPETAGAPPSPETAGAPSSPETAGAPSSPETAAAPPTSETAAAPPTSETAAAPPTSETAAAPPTSETAAAPPTSETAAAPPTSETAVAPSPLETSAAPPTPETAVAPPTSETSAAPPTSETAVAPPTPVTAATPPSLETASQAEPDSAEDQ